MNSESKKQFVKYGGEQLMGKNLIDCHPEPSRTLLLQMLEKPVENKYITEKNGQKKAGGTGSLDRRWKLYGRS
jgi:hypothetical protein